MPFVANVLRVMIASPGDIEEEREIATSEILRWNDANSASRNLVLFPVKWETHSTPQMGGHPQAIINHQLLQDADVLIAIFGTRIGTPTPEFISGTVEEIERCVVSGKSTKIYFSEVPVSPGEIDRAQYESVVQFRKKCEGSGLYGTYKSFEQFRRDFAQHLSIEMNQPKYQWLSTPKGMKEEASLPPNADALKLLVCAAASDDGRIIEQGDMGGYGVTAGDEELADGSARSQARWRAAISEAEAMGALEAESAGIYRLTDQGYKIADSAKSEIERSDSVEAFDAQQNSHARNLVAPMNFIQRDLLRILLLKGGRARNTTLASASASSSGTTDINQIVQPLVSSGLIESKVDHLEGYSEFSIPSGMIEGLKLALFPRSSMDKDKPAQFRGIDS